MELAFNVAWGPISQVAIPLLDIKTAVELAMGAYGWWKARERSLSLVDMIRGAGGQLSSCIHCFNVSRYRRARPNSEMRATAWYDGRLEAFSLPHASTATFGDDGVMCLRALTTALLALYNLESTSAILTRIIPEFLIAYESQNSQLVADGPFIHCVRQFVKSVASEEQSDTIRARLWSQFDEQYNKMLSNSDYRFRSKDVQEVEVPIVVGLLIWIFVPPEKRNVCYPTRSLTAWSLAVMLSYLGFDVHLFPLVISSPALYGQHISNIRVSPLPKVFLVTCHMPTESTDPFSSIPAYGWKKQHSLPPRIVPINAIPMVVFGQLCFRYDCHVLEVEHLCKIWGSSFEYASKAFGSIEVTRGGYVRLPIISDPNTEYEGYDTAEDYENKYVPLLQLLAPQLNTHLPHHRPWGVRELISHLHCYNRNEVESWSDIKNLCIFTAIILSTMFAALCKSLCSDDDAVNALIEVAIDSELMSNASKREKLPGWFQTLRDVIRPDGYVSSSSWITFMFNVLTGDCEESFKNHEFNSFGYYKNGIFLISDMLVRPSVRRDSLIRCHIQRGQPTQLPVDDSGLVLSRKEEDTSISPFNATSLQNITVLSSQGPNKKIRIDIEPDWEEDPRRVVFRVREQGILKCSFSPETLARALTRKIACDDILDAHMVTCECWTSALHHPLPSQQSWKSMEMSEVLGMFQSPTELQSKVPIVGLKKRESILIHAGEDIPAQVLCLVCFETPILFASTCLRCAYVFWDNRTTNSRRPWLGNVLIDGIKVRHSRSET